MPKHGATLHIAESSKVQRLVEAVINALNHRHTDFLPRGELFIGSDFLDYHFPGHKGEMIKQLQQAAPSLGLSLVGVELNSEKSLPLLSSNAYKELQEYFIAGYVNGPISRLIEKYGFKKAMLSTRNDPSLFSRISIELTEEIAEKAALACANGFKAIVLADDIAGKNGLLFSSRYFEDVVLPVYRQIAGAIKAAGLYAFIHSDGDMRKVIDLIAEAGYDCLHPVDAQAGLDLTALQKEFGEKINFMGHIDILGWDETRISSEIKLAEENSLNGGLILGSTGGISIDIPEDKLYLLYPRWKERAYQR
jgi:uroporphyrinogen-III decarboxylase